MASITFDTLELVEKLKQSGLPQEQAEAVVRTIAEAQDRLVTTPALQIELAPIKTDLAVLKWMLAFVLAGLLSLIGKAFS